MSPSHLPPGVVSLCFDDHVNNNGLVCSGCNSQHRLTLLLHVKKNSHFIRISHCNRTLVVKSVLLQTLSWIVRSKSALRSISTTSILASSAAMCRAVWDLWWAAAAAWDRTHTHTYILSFTAVLVLPVPYQWRWCHIRLSVDSEWQACGGSSLPGGEEPPGPESQVHNAGNLLGEKKKNAFLPDSLRLYRLCTPKGGGEKMCLLSLKLDGEHWTSPWKESRHSHHCIGLWWRWMN